MQVPNVSRFSKRGIVKRATG